MNTGELLACYRDGLLHDVVPFWTGHGVDHEHGGFFSALDRQGALLDTDKAVWPQGRFTWVLGKLYNTVERRPEWLALAEAGARFLRDHCFDADGQLFFLVTREGLPLRKRRYRFSEAFAAIGFGEVARATGSGEWADRARAAFRKFVTDHTTPGAMPPKFTDTRPMQSIGFPMITIGIAQELRESIQLPEADEWIGRSIARIRKHFLKPDLQVVMETVGPNGEIYDHFDGRLLNPGHAIEGAWFILREAARRRDAALVRTGCDMLDWMWRRGWDAEYGGILYYRDLYHRPVQEYWHDMKFWWPHNETIIATLLAWQLTGESRYAEWHRLVHDWSYRHFPDSEYGEWFGYLHRDGRVSVDLKGNLWKGLFHLPRMQLVCWKLLESPAR